MLATPQATFAALSSWRSSGVVPRARQAETSLELHSNVTGNAFGGGIAETKATAGAASSVMRENPVAPGETTGSSRLIARRAVGRQLASAVTGTPRILRKVVRETEPAPRVVEVSEARNTRGGAFGARMVGAPVMAPLTASSPSRSENATNVLGKESAAVKTAGRGLVVAAETDAPRSVAPAFRELDALNSGPFESQAPRLDASASKLPLNGAVSEPQKTEMEAAPLATVTSGQTSLAAQPAGSVESAGAMSADMGAVAGATSLSHLATESKPVAITPAETTGAETATEDKTSDEISADTVNSVAPAGAVMTAAAAQAAQTPFRNSPAPIPGVIEAEDFDEGGEGVAYHDLTAGNAGGAYRNTDVDLHGGAENGASNGQMVGWFSPTEWLEYTVNVSKTDTYTLEARVASPGTGGVIHVEVDGVDKTGAMNLPDTGSAFVWKTISKSGIGLTAGQHVIRVVGDANATSGWIGNLDWLRFVSSAPPEMVAYWRFDAGTGSVAADSSGKNNTGTLQGATWAEGKTGPGAVNFNGAGSQVSVNAGAALKNVTNNFTVSFWAKPRATHEIDPEGSNATHYGVSGQRYAIGAEQGEALYGSADHAGVGVSVGTNGISVYEHSGNYMPATVVHQATINDWTHVALVYENRAPKLYVNGALVRTGAISPKAFLHIVPQGIGGHGYGYFDGEMDEVKIFNGAMTEAQVAALAVPPAELVAHWKLDEGNGNSAVDSSGEGNTGTLQGPTRRAGKIGTGALNFDGLNDAVTVVNQPTLNEVVNNFTVAFWAKPRAAQELDPEGYLYGGTTGQKYAIGAEQGEALYGSADHAGVGVSVGTNGISVYEHSGNYMPATVVHQATINDWTHVALVYENRAPKLYVNGALVRTGAISPKAFLHIVPQGIGGHGYGYFDGEMDDVRIYKGALPAEEISALASLVAQWKFNEDGGAQAVDSTGNNNTGALQGATRSVGRDGTGALNFNGVNAAVTVDAGAALKGVINNFTYSFWVKPRAAHEIDAENAYVTSGTSGQKYAIGAQHGGVYTGDLYGTNDHAGAGVSVGTNGISVYEHSGYYMPATLVYPAPISDWTHVTVVYENRVPTLYVNGVHVKTGISGQKSFVHAVPSEIGGHTYGYLDGEMDDVRVYNRALSPAEIQTLPLLKSVNAAPSISLTSPTGGAEFNTPVNVQLVASATDDGTLRKVEFFANGALVATKNEAPYSAAWVNVPAGTYSITARATDDAGVSTTSAAAAITVYQQAGSGIFQKPNRVITADVVAFDQIITYNRLGAVNPAGMIYALRRDVVPIDPSKGLVPGNVQLRKDKRPRPITLRMNVGDALKIKFQNLLAPTPADDNQPHTRTASVHAAGLQLVNNILDDGSNVGRNSSSLVAPGDTATYTLFAEREGNHLMYSTAATTGGEGNGGSLAMGLFGSINVEPRGAEWYRSQLTAQEMEYATTGRTPANQPIINYDAKYPAGHPRAGQYVLRMLNDSLQIIHTDLNAIITGPNRGRFPAGTYPANDRVPDRDQPFREFTVVYHDEIKAVQAFPHFEDDVLSHTLHSVRDAFAINYGTGGIGAEILANRLGVGPMANCTECKYEEFFLTSWVIGDPAQVVDVPASTQIDEDGNRIPGAPRATKVLYPDDPSNVHHSYLNDHVKMRVVHAGPKEHHVHHLHAHQWLRTPDSNDSSYLDSQAMGPGYAFTTEIAHGGSGNLNKTVGDSIFHCHFYPHFAQGMWELWRVHDVFEEGTRLGNEGRPADGARKLPDAEIASGTPIPALVPLPTLAMPPVPTASFQGFPFYIPGVAGHRPPKPPLDTVDDGGLPRHVVTGGTFVEHHTRLDFNKELLTATAQQISEGGTTEELTAMQFHGTRTHPSYTPAGAAANFITNGLPRKDASATGARKFGAQPGAPFADPCVDAQGNAVGTRRVYKGANIQLDLTLNKAGWHFPQSRISVLWDDVRPTINGLRTPEPLFFRAHTQDCIEFFHTNLVPHVYEQDDFQVKTPTDIMGQHIHLVKFDVTASDGSGNGWNYEDGTFSPGEVQERIRAIRRQNGCAGLDRGDGRDGTFTCPVARQHPTLGLSGKDEDGNGIDDWLGAQTTVQRWFAESPSLRTVFTHDHFGPSTHQQAGFYAGLVIEPAGTKWKHNETGVELNTRPDGGPTTWQAAIINPTTNESYREFLLEFSDYQLAYRKDGTPVNPPARKEVPLSEGNWLVEPMPQCPGGVPRPCPEAVSADDVGTMSVNYRNEPLALRVRNPQSNQQAEGEAGDLSHVFRSNVMRADPLFNAQPSVYPALTRDLSAGDPFTPMMRAYEHDRVQIQVLVGGFEEGHNFGVHGIKWLFEPDEKNSGYRNNQMMGISEHFEFIVPKLAKNSLTTDYLYQPGAATDDAWNGLWGLMRAYSQARTDLFTLPNNPSGFGPAVSNPGDFNGVCPKGLVPKTFEVSAVSAGDVLPNGTLVYNSRTEMGGKLHDPTAILFIRNTDLDPATGKLKTDKPEPLILRANAGDCIEVTLTNRLPSLPPDLNGYNTLPMIVERFNNNQIAPSGEVGLHPQLLHYNVNRSNGMNVGQNAVQTAKPGGKVTYQWYAGDITIDTATGVGTATPIEFGAINLTSSDPIKHGSKGAIGALIIEPQGATWVEDTNTRAQATVTKTDGTQFREFVLLMQNDLNLRFGDGSAVPNTAEAEDSEDSGQKGFNYRTEPLWKRMGFAPNTPLEQTREYDFTNVLSNSQVGGDPVTPVFTASVGQAVRMRILMPAGHARNNVFHVHGHIWEEEPYVNDSRALGSNPLSEWKGAQYGVGPGSHFDLLLKNGAGGYFQIRGDYLLRTLTSTQFDGGMWGIFRVQ
jgi:hypothetical protein